MTVVTFGLLWILGATGRTTLADAQSSSSSFSPYELNGGLVTAVAGNDFCIVAADTRMFGGGGYLLQSRNHLSSRLWSVEDDTWLADVEDLLRAGPDEGPGDGGEDGGVVCLKQPRRRVQATSSSRPPIMIGSAGCSTDCCQLQRTVRADVRAASYFGQLSRSDPDQVATMLSQTLYNRRGFPYYAFCVVGGIDRRDGGRGRVYVYDAIGSYEQVAVAAAGTGRELMQPILDRLFESVSGPKQVEGDADDAIRTLCRAYRSVSEREIGVGDKLVLHVSELQPNGDVACRVLVVPLKQH